MGQLIRVRFHHGSMRGCGRPLSPFAYFWAVCAGFVLAFIVQAAATRDVLTSSAAPVETAMAASFGLCGRRPHFNCVIDGDTFYLGGQSIRIADIDTPETHPPRCREEAMLGAQAAHRLRQLLNAGPFRLRAGTHDADSYGRKLRTVVRDGRSLGAMLVAEGLARPWTGRRRPWCG